MQARCGSPTMATACRIAQLLQRRIAVRTVICIVIGLVLGIVSGVALHSYVLGIVIGVAAGVLLCFFWRLLRAPGPSKAF